MLKSGMNAIRNYNEEIVFSIPGKPMAMARKHIEGRPMLDIGNSRFEQLVRDTVKAAGDKPFQSPVKVFIKYNASDLYIVDAAKSVLDGLNRCAYRDDQLVTQLVIENAHEVEGIHILVSNSDTAIGFNLPGTPVPKQEPHSQEYIGRSRQDELQRKRLMKTADYVTGMSTCIGRLENVEIGMQVCTRKSRADIDNICKFYIEAMALAGTINKLNISRLEIILLPVDIEKVDITVLRYHPHQEKVNKHDDVDKIS